MVSGNGDASFINHEIHLKSEYPDEDDDDEPNENDFIAPVEFTDPVSASIYMLREMCVSVYYL